MATPSIGTHMETPLLAPNIDWQKEFSRYTKQPTTCYSKINNNPNKITILKKIKNIINAFNFKKTPLAIIPLGWIVFFLFLIFVVIIIIFNAVLQ
jgi:hypothetical protein